ncbi:MAG TPA: CoA transferase [Vicinamibacterales bacterium]|nr:CoA transferase [Vicinamibacterales bacterium]
MTAPAPLQGVRVVDLSRLLPGAFATLMLAEMGAEVIKIEDPAGGDPMRQLPPILNGRGLYDLLLNRGKKSVVLDLKRDDGLKSLDRLIATADVVVESFRPRTARRFGVSGEQLRARHPRLVHCAITGYGQTGPYAERPGHDLNYVALSGLLWAEARTTGELPRMFMADVGGGAQTAVISMLAAIIARDRHGTGASLDVSMHDSALYWMMIPAVRDVIDDGASASGDLPTFGAHASYNVYETRDGLRLALGALERKFWVAFCQAIDRPDLAARHDTGEADQADLIRETRRVFATRTREEWLDFFGAHDVCLTPLNTPAEALRDPHARARGLVSHQAGVRAVRPPFLGRAAPLAPAPALGANTDEILASL